MTRVATDFGSYGYILSPCQYLFPFFNRVPSRQSAVKTSSQSWSPSRRRLLGSLWSHRPAEAEPEGWVALVVVQVVDHECNGLHDEAV